MLTLKEKDLVDLQNYLGDVPFKYANPILVFIQTRLAEQAQEKE